jgi:hypothetical protein
MSDYLQQALDASRQAMGYASTGAVRRVSPGFIPPQQHMIIDSVLEEGAAAAVSDSNSELSQAMDDLLQGVPLAMANKVSSVVRNVVASSAPASDDPGASGVHASDAAAAAAATEDGSDVSRRADRYAADILASLQQFQGWQQGTRAKGGAAASGVVGVGAVEEEAADRALEVVEASEVVPPRGTIRQEEEEEQGSLEGVGAADLDALVRSALQGFEAQHAHGVEEQQAAEMDSKQENDGPGLAVPKMASTESQASSVAGVSEASPVTPSDDQELWIR